MASLLSEPLLCWYCTTQAINKENPWKIDFIRQNATIINTNTIYTELDRFMYKIVQRHKDLSSPLPKTISFWVDSTSRSLPFWYFCCPHGVCRRSRLGKSVCVEGANLEDLLRQEYKHWNLSRFSKERLNFDPCKGRVVIQKSIYQSISVQPHCQIFAAWSAPALISVFGQLGTVLAVRKQRDDPPST